MAWRQRCGGLGEVGNRLQLILDEAVLVRFDVGVGVSQEVAAEGGALRGGESDRVGDLAVSEGDGDPRPALEVAAVDEGAVAVRDQLQLGGERVAAGVAAIVVERASGRASGRGSRRQRISSPRGWGPVVPER